MTCAWQAWVVAATSDNDESIGGAVVDPRAVVAARNNADWYAMMFDIHGLRYERTPDAFQAIDKPPAYHSSMTLLAPRIGKETLALVAEQARRSDFGIKDSFCHLDLAEMGLAELFSASWIWCESPLHAATDHWIRIESEQDLAVWEVAWTDASPARHRQFPAAILDRSDVAVFGRVATSGFDAGAIGNISPDCVGMSNVFGETAMAPAAALVAEFGFGVPVVGYERGDDLAAALNIGFEAAGQLRVCQTAVETRTN